MKVPKKSSRQIHRAMQQKNRNNIHKKIDGAYPQKKINTPKMTFTYIKNEDGNFVCPDCGVIKKRQNSMHYHMKKHQDELNHICKGCKKGFLQKQTLDLHIRSKHPELLKQESEPLKRFKCPMDNCTFTALTKGNCVIHCLRIHFQEEMKEVMNVHNDTKTITCNECNTEFNNSCGFYYHCKDCIVFDNNDKVNRLRECVNA